MAAPAPTEIEVFLSFARQDDQPGEAEGEPGWVSTFATDLAESLRRGAGREVLVWPWVSISDRPTEQGVMKALRSAKVLVVIVSPAYLKSDESLGELGYFLQLKSKGVDPKSWQIFPVYRQPIPAGRLPVELRDLAAFDFYASSPQAADAPDLASIALDEEDYLHQIEALAKAILETLLIGAEAQGPGDPSEPTLVRQILDEAELGKGLTSDGLALLSAAGGLMTQKAAERDILSTSTAFFAAVEWGLNPQRGLEPPPAIVRMAQELVALNAAGYASVKSGYFRASPLTLQFEADAPARDPFVLSRNFARTLDDAAAAAAHEVTATDLVRALLRAVTAGDARLREHLARMAVRPEDLEQALQGGAAPGTRGLWLCQYSRSEMPDLEARLTPGREVTWRLSPFSPDNLRGRMRDGDKVVLWRSIDEVEPAQGVASQGGIVGWGVIRNAGKDLSDARIVFALTDAFPERPVSRDEVLAALDVPESDWPGQVSLKQLSDEEAGVLRRWDPGRGAHETNLASDRAETTRDLLGRAPLAFTLAHHINRILTQQTKPEGDLVGKKPPDEAAFILHIDSPWGGGKTTFANFVARILNPMAFGLDPPWDKEKTTNEAKSESDAQSLFADLRLDEEEYWPHDYRAREWIPVTFNAWQNQHVTPPWWNFYEAIREQCLEALPRAHRWDARIREWAWRVWSPDFRRTLFTIVPLAVVIGLLLCFESVRALLFADSKDRAALSGLGAVASLALVALTGGSGLALLRSFQAGVRKIVDSAGKSTDAGTLGEADPLRRFRVHFAASVKSYARPVLVIVDDLDRCEPAYVVELVRGMLTIFRAPQVVFMLLGDKSWIVTSFAKVHQDMAGAHEDSEISFGERFAEKAIQLSFILPEPESASRDAYIAELLKRPGPREDGGDAGGDDRAPPPAPPPGQAADRPVETAEVKDFEHQTKDRFRAAKTGTERKAVLAQVRGAAEARFGESWKESRAVQQIINREAALRAASSEQTETDIRHSIAEIKSELPDNPRRIKRIINMIAAYQASAQTVLGVDEDSDGWRQLALWVVLMSEHPEAWRMLCARPDLADRVIAGDTGDDGRPSNDSTKQDPDALLLAALASPRIARLVKGEALAGRAARLDTATVRWLQRVTPIA